MLTERPTGAPWAHLAVGGLLECGEAHHPSNLTRLQDQGTYQTRADFRSGPDSETMAEQFHR